ncbi:MAG: ABC transporter ATP-binding protein [Bacillota bacterium]
MDRAILRLSGVTKTYGSKVVTKVLNGLDLVVEPGEFVAITGPSGSGKSTLFNLVGLLDRPTDGRIELSGQDTGRLNDAALTQYRGRKIGFVFQFHHLMPAFTALENVMMPVLADGNRPTAAIRGRAMELLERVGLQAKADAKVTDLSGGQQQRVSIARALMYNPPLLLADEPTGNLDVETADSIFALLRRINREEGMTCLIITHDQRLAAQCERIITLVDGRIKADIRAASEVKAI